MCQTKPTLSVNGDDVLVSVGHYYGFITSRCEATFKECAPPKQVLSSALIRQGIEFAKYLLSIGVYEDSGNKVKLANISQ